MHQDAAQLVRLTSASLGTALHGWEFNAAGWPVAVAALGVPGGGRVGLIGVGVVQGALGVMHRQFLAVDVDGELLCPLADLLRCHLDPVGEDISEAFPSHQFLGHGHNGLVVPPSELDSVGVLAGNKAVLIAFDGEGDGGASGDGVNSVDVA